MAIYKKQIFLKTKKGIWKCQKCEIENISCSESFWRKNKLAEEKSQIGEHTYLTFGYSKNGNKIVSKAVTYFGKNEKVVRELITTSNVLPKSYEKLK